MSAKTKEQTERAEAREELKKCLRSAGNAILLCIRTLARLTLKYTGGDDAVHK